MPHTAIEDGHVFAVGSGKFANKQFGEVLYSAISRVSQSIVNANRQIDFDHQQAFEEALAAKYGGDPNAIEDYWQTLSDLMDSRTGNVKDRITKANAAEAAVISGARVDGWQRTFATSRDLPRVINELYTDETQRAIVQEALDEFLIGSRSGMTNENGQMAVPFIGIPHKIIFGSDFDNSKSKAEFQGALLTHWLKSMTDEELGVVFGQKIMPAFAEARKTRTAMDWDALGLNTVVTASGKQINIRSLLETLFDPEMDADHFNNLLQTLNSARSGQKTEFTQKVERDAAGAAPVPAQTTDAKLSRAEILNQFNEEKDPLKRTTLLRKLGL
ncbi:MAG: hypothetical protein EBY22_14300 [Gammaproteobacteria bacterium]|nr:hypothetical protein [Gammaproteobacteria bacterium]